MQALGPLVETLGVGQAAEHVRVGRIDKHGDGATRSFAPYGTASICCLSAYGIPVSALNVIPIRLPSLAERRDDIPALVLHFLNHVNQVAEARDGGVAPRERLAAYPTMACSPA